MENLKHSIPAIFVVLWSTGFIGARYAMPWAEPFTFLATRFGLAFVVLLLIGAATGAARLSRRDILVSSVSGILMHGLYLGAVFWAVRQGLTAGFSALIVGLQPLITTILAGVWLGERIRPRHWLGLAAGFAGVVIVIIPKLGATHEPVTMPMLIAAFGAVVAISAGTVFQKRYGSAGNLVMGTAWQFAGATVLMAICALSLETGTVVMSGELIFAMIWLVFVLSIGAVFLLMVLIREGEVAKVSALFYLVPAVTALMAWALFGESLTLVQLGGMALATLGVGLATAQGPTRARASR